MVESVGKCGHGKEVGGGDETGGILIFDSAVGNSFLRVMRLTRPGVE